MSPSVREVFTGPTALLPELTMAGYDHFKAAGELAGHVHSRTYEICHLVSGRVDWWVGDTLCEVGGGELFITGPDESHGGEHAVMNPCELYWFHLTPNPRGGLPGLTADESRMLLNRLSTARPRSFLASEETAHACRRLHELHRAADRRNPLEVIGARGTLHAMLAGVVRDNEAAGHAGRVLSPATQAAVRFMRASAGEAYRIEDVAEHVGINAGTLHAHFLAETGLTPGAWRMRETIAAAKALLAEGDCPITQIAFRLGFSSSQYFATAFHRITAMTPGAYRQRLRASGVKSP